MKAINRKFLKSDEILSFNKSNNFEIEKYFSPKNFNLCNKDKFNLWFDHSYDKIANSITVSTFYYDISKNIANYDSFEYIDQNEIQLPKVGILKNNEFSIPIIVKNDSKILWKISFKINPKIESNLHISISEYNK